MTINTKLRNLLTYLFVFLMYVGCASTQRDCQSCNAETYGADWIVVQYKLDGSPLHCWKLRNIAISSEGHSDGIFWKDEHGNLVHVSSNYNRVQVTNGNFAAAEQDLAVTEEQCK